MGRDSDLTCCRRTNWWSPQTSYRNACMAQLDSLLRIVEQQGANELRLGSDRAPSMAASGVPKKLTLPATTTSTLVELLGELLDPTRKGQLDRLGRVEFDHTVASVGSYALTLTKRPGAEFAFDVMVTKLKGPRVAPVVATAAAPPVVSPNHGLPGLTEPSSGSRALEDPAPTASSPPMPTASSSTLRAPEVHPYRLAEGLAELAARAISMRASDIHFAAHEPPFVRVDGSLTALATSPVPLPELLTHAFGEGFMDRLASRSSIDLSFDLEGGHRARMNVYRGSRGVAAALRLLAPRVPRLAELHVPVPIEDLAYLPSGLVLVTGATGAGKSTTLAALVSEVLANRSVVLVTIEDPIEYALTPGPRSLVRQRQVGRDVPNFANGLRDALREDPDVILVGEMRDPESIHLALTAAETGHLVLSSLHSRSASAAVERIIDTYPAERQAQIRLMLADSLRAVLSQRLVPRAHGEGRVLAMEALRVTTGVAASIRDGKISGLRSAMLAGRDAGLLPLERHLSDLVRARAITLEDARAHANDLSLMQQYLADGRA